MSAIPSSVDEVSVRLVATQVLVLTTAGLAFLLVDLPLVAAVIYLALAVDFGIRTIDGPTHSPLARNAMRWRSRISAPAHLVAFAPKRFAAAIGLTMSVLLTVLALIAPTGRPVALAAAGLMVLFPFLEAAFAFCVGCKIFAVLMRLGMVPESVCLECADISARTEAALAAHKAASATSGG